MGKAFRNVLRTAFTAGMGAPCRELVFDAYYSNTAANLQAGRGLSGLDRTGFSGIKKAAGSAAFLDALEARAGIEPA